MKYFLTFTLLLLLTSCILSGEQEERLNRQLGKYLSSHNDNRVLQYAGLTHPAVVKYYQAQGDSVFLAHFKNPDTGRATIDDPVYVETKNDGKVVQRRYKADFYDSNEELSSDYSIFALSEDGGDNWFFLRQEDYFDKRINGFKRLFK